MWIIVVIGALNGVFYLPPPLHSHVENMPRGIWACVMWCAIPCLLRGADVCASVRWANDEAIHLHKIDIVNHRSHRFGYFFKSFELEKKKHELKCITSTIVLSRPWDHPILNDCNRIAWHMIANWFVQNKLLNSIIIRVCSVHVGIWEMVWLLNGRRLCLEATWGASRSFRLNYFASI